MAESIITQVDRNADSTRRVSISVHPVLTPNSDESPPRSKCFGFFSRCFGGGSSRNERNRESSAVSIQGQDSPAVPSNSLLPPLGGALANRKCLVIDLDETLVHSNFKPVPGADFVVPVDIDGIVHKVYVLKRPGCDEFLRRVGACYEIVIFTASLGKYANPVLDLLDVHRVVHYRLFREACVNYDGNFVKDLSRLGRELKNVIIIDNSSTSYMLQPRNAVPIRSWFDDPDDEELIHLADTLEDMARVPSSTGVIGCLKELQYEMQISYNNPEVPHWSSRQLSFTSHK